MHRLMEEIIMTNKKLVLIPIALMLIIAIATHRSFSESGDCTQYQQIVAKNVEVKPKKSSDTVIENLKDKIKINLLVYHDISLVTSNYFKETFLADSSSELSAWAEVPVIGNNIHIVVSGENLPIGETITINSSLYFVK
jgi:hypothetical protein